MGWCYEFGAGICNGCLKPMVADDTSCTCDGCGSTCLGRFAGCVDVWAKRAGSVTLVNEPWALASSAALAGPVPQAEGSNGASRHPISATVGSGADPGDLGGGSRRFVDEDRPPPPHPHHDASRNVPMAFETDGGGAGTGGAPPSAPAPATPSGASESDAMVTQLREMETLPSQAVGRLGPVEVSATIINELRQQLKALVDQTEERLAPLGGRLGTVEVALSSINVLHQELGQIVAQLTDAGLAATTKMQAIESRLGPVEVGLAHVADLRRQLDSVSEESAARSRTAAMERRALEQEVQAARANQEALGTTVDALRTDIDRQTVKASEDATAIEQRLGPLEVGVAGVGPLRAEVDQLGEAARARDEQVERRLAPVEEAVAGLAGVGDDLAGISSRVAQQAAVLEQRLRPVEAVVAGVQPLRHDVDALVARLAETTTAVEQRLAPLESGVERAEGLRVDLAGVIDRLDEQSWAVEQRLAPMEEGLGLVSDRLGQVEALRADLERLRSLEADVATLGDVRQDFEALASRTEASQQEVEVRLAQRLDTFGAALYRHVQELDRFAASTTAGQSGAFAALSDRVDELGMRLARTESRLGPLKPLPEHVQNVWSELDRISERVTRLTSLEAPPDDLATT